MHDRWQRIGGPLRRREFSANTVFLALLDVIRAARHSAGAFAPDAPVPRVPRYYSGGSYEKLARRAKYASTFTLCKQNVNRNPQLFAFDLGRRTAAPPHRRRASRPRPVWKISSELS